MKFYGIDAQGYIKLQQVTGPPAFIEGTDERKIVYVDATTEDRMYIGGDVNNDWVRIVLDDGSTYPSLVGQLDGVYHPDGGDSGTPFTAADYTGTSNHFRVTDDWIKISDGTPINTGDEMGIKIEGGLGTSDTDDIRLYYDYDAVDDGAFSTHWRFDGGGYATDPIATHSWVGGQVSGGLSDVYTISEIDNRFVRYTQAGDTTTNTTYQQWTKLLPESVVSPAAGSTLAAGRYYHTKQEAQAGFVRVSNWSVNSPANSPKYAHIGDAGLIAFTIAQRDGNSDLWCNILHGTATSAQYADLAEKYYCDESIPVGTVVEVTGEDTDYEVAPCMFELSPVVVGVVSENPAHLMNADYKGLPIALTGRVPVRVIGGVNKGDFIVPAGNGQARVGEPHELVFKIGIALESSLQTPEKLVECVIK